MTYHVDGKIAERADWWKRPLDSRNVFLYITPIGTEERL